MADSELSILCAHYAYGVHENELHEVGLVSPSVLTFRIENYPKDVRGICYW